MIRLKIERMEYGEEIEGLIWYEGGLPVGRVVIEEYHRMVNSAGNDEGHEWIPVEMVEQR